MQWSRTCLSQFMERLWSFSSLVWWLKIVARGEVASEVARNFPSHWLDSSFFFNSVCTIFTERSQCWFLFLKHNTGQLTVGSTFFSAVDFLLWNLLDWNVNIISVSTFWTIHIFICFLNIVGLTKNELICPIISMVGLRRWWKWANWLTNWAFWQKTWFFRFYHVHVLLQRKNFFANKRTTSHTSRC